MGWAATPCGMECGERSTEQYGMRADAAPRAIENATTSALALEESVVSFFLEKRTDEQRWIRRSAGAWCVDEWTDARIVSLSFE